MDFFSILTLLGGLAMFLYGMQVMGDGLEKLSGGKLRRILEIFLQTIKGSSGWRCRDSSYSIVISNDSYGCWLCKLRNHALITGCCFIMGANNRYYDYCMDS